MIFIINFQNLTHLFWFIIITLNLYVMLLLYRVAKDYRLDRAKKLEAIKHLRQHIELRRQQYTIEWKNSTAVSVTNSYDTTGGTSTKPVEQDQLVSEPILRCDSKPYYRLHKLKPSGANAATGQSYKKMQEIFTSRPDSTDSTSVSINKEHGGPHHILYIADSRGHMVQQIPFRECDYAEALNKVRPNRNRTIKPTTKS